MAEQQKKRCLYDVLCVSRDCTPEEIRSAYRRLALQLHPDKLAQSGVINAAEDATAAFQDLLHAYEVLSDPKERAWYDSHRSQILFSEPSSASKSSYSFSGVDLFSYFSTSVYCGYADSRKGFYKVYGDLFAKIYAQELNFARRLGFPSDTIDPAPLFGNLESPYPQVTAFYNYWLGYSTVMDFTWMDEYDSFAGPNRKSRRLMEEENRKVRKKAKREHIDMVRSLAAFVKKRDKRVLDMQKKKNEEEEKRRAEEKERKKEEERKKKERAMMFEEPDWVKNCEEDNLIWDGDEDDDKIKKGKLGVEMYCVACNKKFKSEKQWKNHEQSKKHREQIAELKSAFDDEEEALREFGQDGLCVSSECEPHVEEIVIRENDADQLSQLLKDGLTLQEEEEDDIRNTIMNASSRIVNGIEKHTDYHDLKSIRNGRNHREKRENIVETMDNDENIFLQKDGCEVYKSEDVHLEEVSFSIKEISDNGKGDQIFVKAHKLKKHQSDEKEVRKNDVIPPKSSSKRRKQKGTTKLSNSCETCGEIFESRNKLFSHLGMTGHAMLKSW